VDMAAASAKGHLCVVNPSIAPSAFNGSTGHRPAPRGANAPFEWTVLGFLITLFVWKGLVPAWRELNTDFPNYYLAARLYRDHYPFERLYDWVWFQRQKDHAGIDRGVVGYFPLSPFSALIVAPLASLSPLAAKQCWLCVNLLLLAATIFLLRAMTLLPTRRVAIIVFLSIIPLRTSFQFGQQHLLILFLLTLAGWMYSKKRDVTSGAVLAVAAAIKLYPALFALFFLLKHRWRALASLCSVLALLIVLAAAVFGLETVRVYGTHVLPRAGSMHPYYLGLNSTTELLRRLFVADPDLNPNPLAHAPAAYALLEPSIPALLLISALWLMRDTGTRAGELLHWGAFAALLLVISPGASSYHFCTLILATALGVDFLLGASRAGGAAALVACHALVCFQLYRFVPTWPSGWRIFLGVPRLYALLGYWGVFLWTLACVAEAPRRTTGKAIVFGLAFLALVSIGVVSRARHFSTHLEKYAVRLPVSKGVAVASSPAVTARGIYFSRRDNESYVLDRTGVALVTRAPPRTDLFHPTGSPGLEEGWVEVSSGRSYIARFSLDVSQMVVAELPVEIGNAEQPTVSSDGRWLAFLREDRGHGSLWVAERRSPGQGEGRPPAERQLVDTTHDVFDFSFFPDGRIVLAARRGAATGLFVTSPTSGSLVELATTEYRVSYPSVSADGRWLAYAAEEHGVWQLHLMDLATHEQRRLTHADCNSVMPSWMPDSKSIVFAADCDRGIGETILYRISVLP
jgi:hypothetical protein